LEEAKEILFLKLEEISHSFSKLEETKKLLMNYYGDENIN
jgi:hypothetical protein